MNAPSQQENTALAVMQPASYDLSPRNFEEAWRMAEYLADSDMVPKDFKGRPANCLIAIQWGAELGIKTMQAIQNIAVVNGRPSLWGDVMLALVRNSPLCEYFIEKWEGSGDSLKAVCRTKRRGEPEEQVREFTMDDARKGDLLGKDTYKKFGKRMLQMRARGWLIRDVYTDVIRGLSMAEEALDMPPPEKFMGPADVVGTPPPPPPPPPTEWPADLFAQRLPEWRAAIKAKRATPDAIVAKARTKYPLTAEQEKAIREQPKSEATDAAPKVTFAQVADDIAKAGDLECLAVAGDLIRQVGDEQQRAELQAKYDARETELKEGATK